MHKLMLWMLMLMGAAAATGQETAIRPQKRETRQAELTELGRRVDQLRQVLNASRREPRATLGEPARTSSADKADKDRYTSTIKRLRAQLLAWRRGGNRKSDQQAAPDNATPPEPAVGSTNPANTANQADAAVTTGQQVVRSQRYHFLLGKLAHNRGDSEEVLNAFQQVDDPGQLGPSDAQNFHLLKAISHRKRENYTAAAAEYQALLDRLPQGDPLRTTVEWFQLHCEWLARNAKSQQAAQ